MPARALPTNEIAKGRATKVPSLGQCIEKRITNFCDRGIVFGLHVSFFSSRTVVVLVYIDESMSFFLQMCPTMKKLVDEMNKSS